MRQSKNEVQYNDCIFCEEQPTDGIFFMMNDAIKLKYLENPKEFPTSYIDTLLRIDSPASKEEAQAACKFREWQVIDDYDEFLKREYKMEQYGAKIAQLSQYYKFHSDIPRVLEVGVEKIMSRYYDKKRECDYKRIKKVLKEEQGLSITSVHDSSSEISGSRFVRKSKYSTLLNGISQANLNDLSESKVLYDLCKQMDKALPNSKADPFSIKGSFPQERVFEYYLKSQEKKLKDKLRERNNLRQGGKVLKKFNYQQFVKSREKPADESKESKEVKPTKDERKPEREGKFVFNTNIKIQIRNAMFYSEGQTPLKMANLEYDPKDNRFKKKPTPAANINPNPYRSSQKIAAQIYKSSQHDLRLRNYAVNQRVVTKQNMNLSRSKEKRKSTSKQLQPDLKKGVHAHSARKLLQNEWVLTSKPGRSLSTSSIKKRSISTHAGIAASSSTKRLQRGILEKRPMEALSRYGSSEYNPIGVSVKESKSVSIKELLNRKLKFNIQ